MPDVEWSTVPGPRSRGFDIKKPKEGTDEEKAMRFFVAVKAQMKELKMEGCFIVMESDGVMKSREVI
ncbi:MAG: hypothetical protein OK457_00650 [Thaumarchaeota archaeon]|nr:hypothetical protein [Nitrososphaerota archaeon]